MDEKLEVRVGRFKETWSKAVEQRGKELDSYSKNGGIGYALAASLGTYTKVRAETELFWRFQKDVSERTGDRGDAETLEKTLKDYVAHVAERRSKAGERMVRAYQSGERVIATHIYDEGQACEEVMQQLRYNFPEYVAKGWR